MKRTCLVLSALLSLIAPNYLEAQIFLYDSGDTFISEHTPNGNYNNSSDQTPDTTNLLEIKTSTADDYNRIGYLQFNLSPYSPSQFTDTSLTLTIGPAGSGTLTPGHTWTLNLYGLDPAAASAAAAIGVSDITWANTETSGSTGFHSATSSGITNAVLLGTIIVTDSGANTIWTISGSALDDYLASAGSTAAFVISRTENTTNGSVIHTIYNSSAGAGLAPVLAIAAPEPRASMLIFCGLLSLVVIVVRRRVGRNV